jgi:hypothetical protein
MMEGDSSTEAPAGAATTTVDGETSTRSPGGATTVAAAPVKEVNKQKEEKKVKSHEHTAMRQSKSPPVRLTRQMRRNTTPVAHQQTHIQTERVQAEAPVADGSVSEPATPRAEQSPCRRPRSRTWSPRKRSKRAGKKVKQRNEARALGRRPRHDDAPTATPPPPAQQRSADPSGIAATAPPAQQPPASSDTTAAASHAEQLPARDSGIAATAPTQPPVSVPPAPRPPPGPLHVPPHMMIPQYQATIDWLIKQCRYQDLNNYIFTMARMYQSMPFVQSPVYAPPYSSWHSYHNAGMPFQYYACA